VAAWLPALKHCGGLQHLEVELCDQPDRVNVWSLLRALAPHLVHLTSLTFSADAYKDGIHHHDSVREPPQPCFPALRTITCNTSMLAIARNRQWRLLAACPSLVALQVPLIACVPPPPDLGQLGLTQLGAALLEGWAEAGALLRHCPLVQEVVMKADDASLPEVRGLARAPRLWCGLVWCAVLCPHIINECVSHDVLCSALCASTWDTLAACCMASHMQHA
jgi:hypothetical protein